MLSPNYVVIEEHTNSRKVITYQGVIKRRRFLLPDKEVTRLRIRNNLVDAAADIANIAFTGMGVKGGLKRATRRALARSFGKGAFTN